MKTRNECTVLAKLRASTFLFATSILITLVVMEIALNLETPYYQSHQLPLFLEVFEYVIGTIWGLNIVVTTVVSGMLMIKAVFELIMIGLDTGEWW